MVPLENEPSPLLALNADCFFLFFLNTLALLSTFFFLARKRKHSAARAVRRHRHHPVERPKMKKYKKEKKQKHVRPPDRTCRADATGTSFVPRLKNGLTFFSRLVDGVFYFPCMLFLCSVREPISSFSVFCRGPHSPGALVGRQALSKKK
jgi:hypothetical protein